MGNLFISEEDLVKTLNAVKGTTALEMIGKLEKQGVLTTKQASDMEREIRLRFEDDVKEAVEIYKRLRFDPSKHLKDW